MPTRLGLGAPGRTDNAPPDQVYAGEGKRADGLVEENDCEQRTDDWHDVEVRTGCGRASCPLERKRAQLDAGRRFAGSRLHAGLQAVWRADSRVKEFARYLSFQKSVKFVSKISVLQIKKEIGFVVKELGFRGERFWEGPKWRF